MDNREKGFPVSLFPRYPVLLPARLALVTTAITATIAAATITAATTAATVTTTTAATTIGSRLGFVDCEITTAKILAVKLLDRRRRFFRSCHFHKGKTARAAGVAILDYGS